ncbi:hypothetical protein C8F04DRAFT_1276612 [Mycena alexandri]|uniref:Uncharacterized protein n=1 Tax=Mycena alexandri TaxID=1745969 RepID=A0AAD6S291_9AGAR|nr:hypothetical protein C8F04DRAFT_1276612 [Mycena alexandri]
MALPKKSTSTTTLPTTAADRAARFAKRASSAPAPDAIVTVNLSPPTALPSVPEAQTTTYSEVVEDTAETRIDVDAIESNVSNDPATQPVANVDQGVIDVDAAPPISVSGTSWPPIPHISFPPVTMTVDSSSPGNARTPSPPVEEYPSLPTPGLEIQSDPKGKGKAKRAEDISVANPYPDIPKDGFEDFFDTPDSPVTAAATARAIALSLGQQPALVTAGASSSRRPGEDAPGSPSKRQRANTVGDSIPTSPFTSTPRSGRIPNPAAERVANPRAPPPTAPVAHPRYRTADGLPPRGSFTPTPEEGWHPLFGIDSGSVWRAHPDIQRGIWDDEDHPKFLVLVSGGNGDRIQTTEVIGDTLAAFVNVDPESIQVGTPGSAQGPHDARAWLIGGLPQHLAEAVLDMGVLSCAEISLFALPYSPPIAGFIGTISGFTIRRSPAGAARAQEYIRAAMASSTAITQFVRAHRDSFPPEVDADGALEIFLASVGVRGIDLLTGSGTTITAWNTYVVSPTESVAHFNHLRSLFAALVIHTGFAGEGRIHKALQCTICPCIDHPTNLCPFPAAPGWMGANPETIGALLDISRAARTASNPAPRGGSTRGRGGRGNGRGNSRGGRAGNGRGRGN